MVTIYVILIVCLLLAFVFDGVQKKIPNVISLIIIVAGLWGNFFFIEGLGFQSSAIGILIGALLMSPGYFFATMGAGDVKLVAAIGALVGVDKVLDVVYYSYLFMFVMAMLLIIIKGDIVKLLLRCKRLVYIIFKVRFAYQRPGVSNALNYSLPLAPAIVLATFYVIYPQVCNLGMLEIFCAASHLS